MLRTDMVLMVGLIAITIASPPVFGAETDQYLSWGIELDDSAEAINRYLNEEIRVHLNLRNERDAEPATPYKTVVGVYLHLFKGLHASRLRHWLHHSDEVDRWPNGDISYFKHYRDSIYWGPVFPFMLPMSRTIRVGDVYCGTDKFEHFFGFGRRYFGWYSGYRRRGMTDEEAAERTVLRGIWWENSLVGKLVDGIFSHGDLEADYQGMCLARDMVHGEHPYLQRDEEGWRLVRAIDIRDYVTPDFDESYNPPHYAFLRKRFAHRRIEKFHKDKLNAPEVRARFAAYRHFEPSLSKRVIQEYFRERGEDPQSEQYLEAFGVSLESITSKEVIALEPHGNAAIPILASP